jgi:predicted secreted protein
MALAAVGFAFKRENDVSSGVFDNIAEIRSFDGPEFERDFLETTTMDTSGGWRTWTPSFRDGGLITLEMNFTVAAFNSMWTDFLSSTAKTYQMVMPDAGNFTIQLDGFVTGTPLKGSTDELITMTATIKVTGQPTLIT